MNGHWEAETYSDVFSLLTTKGQLQLNAVGKDIEHIRGQIMMYKGGRQKLEWTSDVFLLITTKGQLNAVGKDIEHIRGQMLMYKGALKVSVFAELLEKYKNVCGLQRQVLGP